jgi:DNA-binding transcriptional LysR family regulator
MEDLAYMVTFARVVKAGSFAGAARRLKVTSSVASKHVAKLEKALGVRLLNRSTRKLSLTEAGAAYYEHCARIVEEVESSKRAIAELQAVPRGLLRVTAPVTFANTRLGPILREFFERYPEIQIDLNASNRLIDLAEEGYDVAIRIARTLPPNVVARELRRVRWHLCGAPQYLEREGEPVHPANLTRHNCLSFSGPGQTATWHFVRGSERSEVPIHGNLASNTVEALHEMVLAGAGLTLLPGYMAGKDIRDGLLRPVLADWEVESGSNLYAVFLPTRYLAPKVRVFVDFLVEKFGARREDVGAKAPATKDDGMAAKSPVGEASAPTGRG